ncbi:MAG: glycoside hydrolase family 130 protein [Verrucomicrobiia bacterium]
MKAVSVQRTGPLLLPDRKRVLIRPFHVSDDDVARRIVGRVLAMPEETVSRVLADVFGEFGGRHSDLEDFLHRRYREVERYLPAGVSPSQQRQLLLGAYFTHEYSLEAAALFNPSIVPHPDQTDLEPGSLRFVLSLRATGEGHISSITFRTGVISPKGKITVAPPAPFVSEPERVWNAQYEQTLFRRKLSELGVGCDFCWRVLDELPEHFTMAQLRRALETVGGSTGAADPGVDRAIRGMILLAESNYEVRFKPGRQISQRVVFPLIPSQRNGIEDARFVRFQDEDGSTTYYATYTAYDGRIVLPQLLETPDFELFRFVTLNGPAVRNKGMALFPRRINGCYAMLSRQDDENIFLMYSKHPHFWYEAKLLVKPEQPWELLKMGNCGSPIETHAGWLVLTHGVGPMRKYCLGAVLLDLHNPAKVIGRLRTPLLSPDELEREGYVPNVVYTCGALLHRDVLIIPYAMSDYASSFAKVRLSNLLAAMD